MRNPERDQKVALPTREGIVNAQIGNILGVVATLNPFLLKISYRELEETPEIDGGAAMAAANTFIKCCDRLDEIMSDKSRWDLKKHDELYESMEKVNVAQEKFLLTQAAAAEVLTRPSFQLKPTIIFTTKEFLAFWGDPNTPGGGIIGHGATAELALRSFDAAFHKAPDEQILTIAERLGFDLSGLKEEAVPTAPPEPKSPKNLKKRKK